MESKDIKEIYAAFLDCVNVSTDTRSIEKGDMYIALIGERYDGNDFVDIALEKGASAIITSRREWERRPEVYYVDDTLVALQALALHHREVLDIPILSITGSNGKTTTKELISNVLSTSYMVMCTKGNLNNHIGLPLTLLTMKTNHDFGIVEMGANHQGEIEQLMGIAKPNYCLITNIGKAHLEGFKGLEGVMKGKGEMYDQIKVLDGTIFCNSSQPLLKKIVGDYPKTVWYNDGEVVVKGEKYKFGLIDNPFCKVDVESSSHRFRINTALAGGYNYRNVVSAIVIGLYFKIDIEKIAQSLDQFKLSMNRSERIQNENNIYILDAYNANPSSMEVALSNLQKEKTKRRGVVLGEMLELGEESEILHRQLLDQLSKIEGLNFIVLIGEAFKIFKNEYDFYFFNDIDEARSIREELESSVDVCLIKGSRKNSLEKWFS